MSQKNLVIIMADQLRIDMLGQDTPNINKLANEGVSFNKAYCASPLCVPARGAFFTGTYPNVNGSIINPWFELDAKHGDVKEDYSNLYESLEEGFDSWHAGKQHLYTQGGKLEDRIESKTHWIATGQSYRSFLKENNIQAPGGPSYRGRVPEMAMGKQTRVKEYSIPKTGCYEPGFDYFFDGYFANQGVKAIKERDKNKPFLLNAMFLAPHPPLDIPKPWFSMYDQVELPDNVGQWYKDQSPLQMYNLTGVIGSRYSREDWGQIWPVYKGLVSLLDHCVGMLINELKAQAIYDDTLIIFTSDHGEMLGSHGLWQKMCMYEESVRIPMIMKFPSDFEYQVKEVEETISAVDVLPTIYEYFDIELPKTLSGQSLLKLLKGESLNRDYIFIQFDGNGARSNFQRAIIDNEFKLIVDIFKDEVFIELYHIASDPQEKLNLIYEDQYSQVASKMIDALRKHMLTTGDLLRLEDDLLNVFKKNYSKVRR